MGQKVNPNGIRLGIVRDWDSTWYAEENFADYVYSDFKVREFLRKKLADAGISHINIQRPANNAKITVYVARPGVAIGQRGKGAESLRDDLAKIMGVPVHINIEELRKPELEAQVVADTIARQLEQRVMFRKAMKRAVANTMRAGAEGIKVCVSGRLGGAEIARNEKYREGRVPLHTFRADIVYALAEAHTTYGVIGVKVWIFRSDNIGFKKRSKPVKRNREDRGDQSK